MGLTRTLTRDAVLCAADTPLGTIDVPEWGGAVRCRTIDADIYCRLRLLRPEESDSMEAVRDAVLHLLVACLCDDAGAALFTDADIPALGQRKWAVLSRVARECQRHNGLTDEQREESRGN